MHAINTKLNWPTPDKFPELSKQHVHVWCAQIDQLTDQLFQLKKLLSADETNRAEKFHFEKDRHRFIISRGLLRTILGHYAKIAPEQLEFHYTAHGKPELNSFPELQFNLSHAENIILCAFSSNYILGIDVEYLGHDCDMEEIAKRFFSPLEYQILKNLTGQKQRRAFFNGWTRKEAFLKAIGKGLSFSLSKVEVPLLPEETVTTLTIHDEQIKSQPWALHALSLASDYAAALVTKGKPQQIHTWHWNKEFSF